jgi:hypothetical protein
MGHSEAPPTPFFPQNMALNRPGPRVDVLSVRQVVHLVCFKNCIFIHVRQLKYTVSRKSSLSASAAEEMSSQFPVEKAHIDSLLLDCRCLGKAIGCCPAVRKRLASDERYGQPNESLAMIRELVFFAPGYLKIMARQHALYRPIRRHPDISYTFG